MNESVSVSSLTSNLNFDSKNTFILIKSSILYPNYTEEYILMIEFLIVLFSAICMV